MTLGFRALRFSAERRPRTDRSPPDKPGQEARNQRLGGRRQHHDLGRLLHLHVQVPAAGGGHGTEARRTRSSASQIMFNLVDGVIRIALFLLFIWGVSLLKDIRRVYEYHGAEHKTVFAFENGDPLADRRRAEVFDIPSALRHQFPDDGDDLLDSWFTCCRFPVTTFWARFATVSRCCPVIAGLSYEIIRFAAKHRGSLFAMMTAPGLWLQRITTQPPVGRPGPVRHRRPRPGHGARKATRRRTGDCLAVPAANICSLSRTNQRRTN